MNHRRLAHAVHADIGQYAQAGNRRDVDDAATQPLLLLRARNHLPGDCLRDKERAFDVRIEHEVIVDRGHFGEPLRRRHAGIVDQYVDRPHFALDLLDRVCDRFLVGHVKRNDVGGAASSLDFRAQVFQTLESARGQHGQRTVGRQHAREARSEAATGAGDQRYFFFQVRSHEMK